MIKKKKDKRQEDNEETFSIGIYYNNTQDKN